MKFKNKYRLMGTKSAKIKHRDYLFFSANQSLQHANSKFSPDYDNIHAKDLQEKAIELVIQLDILMQNLLYTINDNRMNERDRERFVWQKIKVFYRQKHAKRKMD